MARIIYAVAGEGFGHSSRSHLIGRRFLDAGHDVMFAGSQKSLLYLKQYFGERVREIFGLSFSYIDGRIDKSETLKKNLLKLPEANRLNDELFKKHFEPFRPELVISDFEPFSAWWAWRKKVPFISIDHEHVLTLCELEHPVKNWFSRLTAGIVTECGTPDLQHCAELWEYQPAGLLDGGSNQDRTRPAHTPPDHYYLRVDDIEDIRDADT